MNNSSYLMFVGTYTDFDILAHLPHNKNKGKGIYPFHFHNGELTSLPVIPALNPAVMTFHPKNHKILYSLSEGIKDNGIIDCFYLDVKAKYGSNFNNNNENKNEENNNKKIKIKLMYKKKKSFYSNGRSTCYFSVEPFYNKYGIIINYWEGSVDIIKLNKKNGCYIKHIQHIQHCENDLKNGKKIQVKNREDHWKNRMVGPHAHSVHFYNKIEKATPWVFIPDLGTNSIFQYAYNENNKSLLEYEGEIYLKDGEGPRHMIWHPFLKVAYVSNELGSTVTVLEFDDTEPKLSKLRMKILQTLSTKPINDNNSSQIDSKNYVSEICISRDGNYVYISNRGHDSIACFYVNIKKNGILQFMNCVSTYGKCPRHFNITPDDKYLICANQDSDSLVVFKRDITNGNLIYINKINGGKGDDIEFSAPNFIIFYPISIDTLVNQNFEKKNNNNNDNSDDSGDGDDDKDDNDNNDDEINSSDDDDDGDNDDSNNSENENNNNSIDERKDDKVVSDSYNVSLTSSNSNTTNDSLN